LLPEYAEAIDFALQVMSAPSAENEFCSLFVYLQNSNEFSGTFCKTFLNNFALHVAEYSIEVFL